MGTPGVQTDVTATPRKVRVGVHGSDTDLDITLDATAVDAGNTPTTTLRKGLAIGLLTASGKAVHYSPAESDGSETGVGLLADEVDMTDGSADGQTAVEQLNGAIQHGVIDESETFLVDAAFKTDLGASILWR